MKQSHFKHIILAVVFAMACAPAVFSQVNINAPTGLNRGTQPEPEKKVETPATTTEPKPDGGGENNGAAVAGGENNGAAGAGAVKPRPAQSTQPYNNNTAVNSPNNEKKPWVDSKKPESLNRDFSTGKNSSNLQSRQEVEMRSYGYRILVYHTNKSK